MVACESRIIGDPATGASPARGESEGDVASRSFLRVVRVANGKVEDEEGVHPSRNGRQVDGERVAPTFLEGSRDSAVLTIFAKAPALIRTSSAGSVGISVDSRAWKSGRG